MWFLLAAFTLTDAHQNVLSTLDEICCPKAGEDGNECRLAYKPSLISISHQPKLRSERLRGTG